jgi:hypothetical protein
VQAFIDAMTSVIEGLESQKRARECVGNSSFPSVSAEK